MIEAGAYLHQRHIIADNCPVKQRWKERHLMANNFEQANLFELGDYSIQVTYSSTSFTGQPQLNYRDNNFNLNFAGEEIRVQDTEIGQLITVTLETVTDLRTMTFTLILPLVNVMPQSGGTQVQVPGILTTTHT